MGGEWSRLWASSWVRLWALSLFDQFAHQVANGVYGDGHASGDEHSADEVVARALFTELRDAVAEGQQLSLAGLADWRECADGFREPLRLCAAMSGLVFIRLWFPRGRPDDALRARTLFLSSA